MGAKSIHTLGDPLGPISRRYAEDEQKLTEVKEYIVQDTLSKGVQVPIYGATHPELSKLFGIQESKAPFASFQSPENFASSLKLSPTILSTVGSLAQYQEAQEKLKAFKATGKNVDEQTGLVKFLEAVQPLETDHTLINAKRNQYGKG